MASAPFAASYPGTCKKCQKRIEVGDMVRWAGKGVVQHDRCSSAWREAQTAAGGPILPLLQPKPPAPTFQTQAELDELLALDDALSSVPMVEARSEGAAVDAGAGNQPGRIAAPARSAPAAARSLPAEPDPFEASAPPRAELQALASIVGDLRSVVGSLAGTVRVLATATERIAAALPPDKYLVPKDHWTRTEEPTTAGADLKTGDPF